MRLNCPNCRQLIEVPDTAVGRNAICKGCGNQFRISAPKFAMQETYAVTPTEPTPAPMPRVSPPPQTTEIVEDRPSLPLAALQWLAESLPGLFRPWLLIQSIIVAAIGFIVLGFCIWFLLLGAVLAACTVGGAGLVLYGQAIAMIITGQRGFLQELLTEFDGRSWLLFFFLLFLPFAVLYFLLLPYMPQG